LYQLLFKDSLWAVEVERNWNGGTDQSIDLGFLARALCPRVHERMKLRRQASLWNAPPKP
jgi:hypothetical protein